MIANATSAQQYSMAQVQVGEFLLQLPELRHMTEAPWGVKGEERKHIVLKFGGLCVDYFPTDKKATTPSCTRKTRPY